MPATHVRPGLRYTMFKYAHKRTQGTFNEQRLPATGARVTRHLGSAARMPACMASAAWTAVRLPLNALGATTMCILFSFKPSPPYAAAARLDALGIMPALEKAWPCDMTMIVEWQRIANPKIRARDPLKGLLGISGGETDE